MLDYHIHPDFSIDATGSVDEYCRKALELGLREICFTPHYETDPEREHLDGLVRVDGKLQPVTGGWLDVFFNTVEKAKENYGDRIGVKAGIEVDHIPERCDHVRRVISGYPFDFVLGAVHSLDHIAISSSSECGNFFCSCDVDTMFDKYFDLLYQAVDSGLYDAMAHFDIYRRFGYKYYAREDLEGLPSKAHRVIKKMADRKMAMEINTSGLRCGVKSIFPGPEVLRYAVACGVTEFTVGSDAHSINDLGRGIFRALGVLDKLDIENITVYTKRTKEKIPMSRGRVCQKPPYDKVFKTP